MFANSFSVRSPLPHAAVTCLPKMCGYLRTLLVTCLLIIVSEALTRRETQSSTTSPLLLNLTKVQHHVDEFRSCVDKHLAGVVGDVQEDQLQPVLSVIGDQVARLAKAWDALTAPKSTPSPDDDDDD